MTRVRRTPIIDHRDGDASSGKTCRRCLRHSRFGRAVLTYNLHLLSRMGGGSIWFGVYFGLGMFIIEYDLFPCVGNSERLNSMIR